MCCQPFTLLLCFITILYARNGILATSRCACKWNSSTLTADCSYDWLPSSKRLTEVPSTDCVPATTKILDLSFNNITYQPEQFQKFTALTGLNLRWNEHFTPGNGSFSGLGHLRELRLDYTDLKNFRKSLFNEPSILDTLLLRGTVLGNLTTGLFDNLQHLKVLNLRDAQIMDTHNYPFAALPSLENLSLVWNHDIILTKQSFTGLTNLWRLDISDCGLTYLNLDVFDELSSLSVLDLSWNVLNEIRDNQFASLRRLQRLELRYSRGYTQFNPLSFAGLSELKYLNLGHAELRQFKSFPNDVFKPLHRIEELILLGFCIDMDSYQYHQGNISDNLRNLSTLKKLHFDNYVISFLDTGFSVLENLQELTFDGGYAGRFRMDSFSNTSFENLRNSSVTTLAIDNFETEHIAPNAFSYFSHLTTLNLTNWKLNNWCNGFADDVETGLQATDITYMRIQLRCEGSFNLLSGLSGLDGTHLETLDLSEGSVTYLGKGFFHNLPASVKHVFLQGNSITYAVFYDIHKLQNLVLLDLSNQIRVGQQPANSVLGGIYHSVETLNDEHVSIDANTVDEFTPIRGSKVPQKLGEICYKLPKSLATINIEISILFCDLKTVLCNPDNGLKTLILADQYLLNPRCTINDVWELLKNLRELETLNLNGNNIKSIPTGALKPLRLLRNLLLKRNALAIVQFDLPSSQTLQTLDLSHNNVLYISTDLCETLDEIADRHRLAVYLNNNSFLCDCERIEFVAWLRGGNAIYEREKLTCQDNSEKKYNFSEICKLHETLKYKCTVKEFTLGCTAVFVMSHLVLGILYLAWYRRWKFRYLLAIGRKIVYPFHPIEDCQIELEYDVYISYERDFDVTRDRTLHELVTQVIYPGLQHRGYRVVIRDELTPGIGLYHTISHTLRRCKKVVALVTRDYCRDYWNVFEFNISVLEGIYTKRQVMIPVAFEEIGRDDLHDEIFAFLVAGEIGHHTANVTDEMLVDYLCDKIRDNREFGE